MYYVYKAIHTTTGKFYIGMTDQGIRIREDQHWTTPIHKKKKFHRFLHATNREDWNWVVLATFENKKDCINCELYYINVLKSVEFGLNDSRGTKSPEVKRASALVLEEYRKQHPGSWHKGRTGVYSEATLERMRLAKLKNPVRAPWTEERKLKASREYGKKIKELGTGLQFDSISKAAKHFNIRRECVRDVVNKRRTHTHGLVFIEVQNEKI
jgi:group I intron endonuclease